MNAVPTSVTTSDGLALPLRHWPAEARGGSRGVAVLVHGLGEHIGRYEHVARRLTVQGFDVIGVDQRGHGRAPGPRGGLPRADSLLDDLSRVIDVARATFPGPLVLLGHSLGGLIVGRFVAEALRDAPAAWSRPVDALIMSSPALDPGTNALQKLLLAVVAPRLPRLAVSNGLKPDWISRDPAVVAAYLADPLVHDRITGRLGLFVAENGPQVIAAAPRWKVPTLLMWAGADRCVSPAGSAAFAAAARPSRVATREWPGLAHEIFNEPEQAEVLHHLGAWLHATLPAQQAA